MGQLKLNGVADRTVDDLARELWESMEPAQRARYDECREQSGRAQSRALAVAVVLEKLAEAWRRDGARIEDVAVAVRNGEIWFAKRLAMMYR